MLFKKKTNTTNDMIVYKYVQNLFCDSKYLRFSVLLH